jgi:uncharacterized protein
MIYLRRDTNAAYRLKVKRSRAGLGLYAEEDIPKGVKIIEYVGRVMIDEPDEKKGHRYIFNVDRHMDIEGSPRWNVARYINHACRPNAESYIYAKHVWIRSIKRIAKGEEITYDYGKEYWKEYIGKDKCSCRTCIKQRGV